MGRFFSTIHISHWIKPKVKQMNSDTKLLWTYILTNHHGNGAGFYHFNPAYGAIDLDHPLEIIEQSLARLVELELIMHNLETNALFVRVWFDDNGIGSSKNAGHFITLHEQKRLPQNEPEMEREFFRNLAKAAEGKKSNENFRSFFDFLSANITRLDPTISAGQTAKGFTSFDAPFGP